MFKFFKKKEPPGLDFSVLGIDIHSHLIPGVDDGSPDVSTSVQLIKGLYELGFRHFITTPHVMFDLYPNTPEDILDGLEKVRTAIAEEHLDIQIDAAAEYQLDEGFESLLQQKKLLSLRGKYVLVEMPFLSAPPKLYDYLLEIKDQGLEPILAHPERYFFLKNNMGAYERLINMGCLLQLNILSLIGYYGKPSRESALQLLEEKWVTFLGTDLHHKQQLRNLKKALKDPTVQQILEEYEFQNKALIPASKS